MSDDMALRIIGGVCIAMGVISALWGGKRLPDSGLLSSRLLLMGQSMKRHKWLPRLVGVGLICAGLIALFQA